MRDEYRLCCDGNFITLVSTLIKVKFNQATFDGILIEFELW